MIALIRTPSRGHGTTDSSAFDDLRAGIAYVRSQRWIWVTLIVASLFTLFYWGPVQVLLPYIVRNDLGGGPETFGLILAADGVGSVVASIILSQRGLPRRYLSVLYARGRSRRCRSSATRSGTHAWQLMVLAFAARRADHDRPRDLGGARADARAAGHARAASTSVDWFVSIGFAPLSFALTGPAAAALGVDDDADHRRRRSRGRHRRDVRRCSGWAASSRRSLDAAGRRGDARRQRPRR